MTKKDVKYISYNAFCENCEWEDGMYEGEKVKKVKDAINTHVSDTGHIVTVESKQIITISLTK
jgi:hypothetical protein